MGFILFYMKKLFTVGVIAIVVQNNPIIQVYLINYDAIDADSDQISAVLCVSATGLSSWGFA